MNFRLTAKILLCCPVKPFYGVDSNKSYSKSSEGRQKKDREVPRERPLLQVRMLPETEAGGQLDVRPGPASSGTTCARQDSEEARSTRPSSPAEGDPRPDDHSSATERIDHALHTLKSELVCILSLFISSFPLSLCLCLSLSVCLSVSPCLSVSL